MSKFSIYSYNGQVVRYEGKPRYNGNFGQVSYLEFQQIASPVLIDFHVGDYVDYSRTGFRYKLYDLPKPTKKSGNDTVGDTYVYKNVKFYCATKELEIAPFRDLVLNDNLIHFTTLPTISVYDDVYGIADRIQACMDDYSGQGVWDISVVNTSDPAVSAKLSEEKEFSVSGISCLGALDEIYRLWQGIGWIYAVVNGKHTIVLGRPNIQDANNTTDVFSYGKDNGLKVIAQAVSEKNEMATRLYAYGSDRNLIPRYYNNLSPAIFSAESVYIPNLMIPPSNWGTTNGRRDARKAYVEDAGAISAYGLIPKTIYFDGSGEYEEIYPSLEGMTFAELRSAMSSGDPYYPSNIYPNSAYVNTIKSVENPDDNGIMDEGGSRYAESGRASIPAISETFTYEDGQMVLNADPGGVLATYTVSHSGKLKINGEWGLSVECSDAIEVTAVLVVYVNDVAEQIVDLPVLRTRMDSVISATPVTQDVTAGDEVALSLGVEVRLPGDAQGSCYITSGNFGIDFNVQYNIADGFTMRLKQIGFDISKQGSSLSNGLATISMKSGFCGGREFVIKSCKYESATDDWVIECYRQKDDSLGQYFPNSIYPIHADDSYVLVDMMMPDIYVGAAQDRLLERAREVLGYMCKPQLVYTPEIDAKVLAMAPETILEGMYMPVYDENLIPTTVQAHQHTVWVLISSLVISEDESEIPLYKVTLADEKAGSFLQSYTNEMAANARRLRMEAEAEARSPYIPDDETGNAPAPYVEIIASSEYFTYPTGETEPVQDTITLQAVPHDITNPTYQWYWLGVSGWEALTGETDQIYEVDPNSTIYYQDGETAEDFRCVVTSGGAAYSARKTIVKISGGEDALSVMLNNPAHIFAAGTANAYDGSDTINVIAYVGTSRAITYVGAISGEPNGMSTSISNNNTTYTSITISVTTALSTQSGVLTIPVTVAGQTVNLTYSWALGLKGQQGAQGPEGDDGYNTAAILLYQRGSSAPAKPQQSLTYNFANGTLTGNLNGWSQTPQQTTTSHDPLWMISAQAVSRYSTDVILANEWAGPIKFVEDGLGVKGADGKIMRGPTEWVVGFPYEGIDDEDATFVDYVIYDNDPDHLYVCKKSHTGANDKAPGNTEYWTGTTVQDFVATKVIYSSLGYVENLGVNVLKIQKAGTVTGGFMPPSTDNNGNTIFWAGGSTPDLSPFKIDNGGNVTATSGTFGPYSIEGQYGFTYNDNNGILAQVHKQFIALNNDSEVSGSSQFDVDTTRNGTTPLVHLEEYGRNAAALQIGSGYIQGFRLGIKTTGNTNLSLAMVDNVAICNNTSTISVALPSPSAMIDGHFCMIIHTTSSTLNITSTKPIVQVLSTGIAEVYTAPSGRPEVMLVIYSANAQKWYLSYLKSS